MRVAIAACSDRIDAMVDPNFGRCSFFCIYDSATDGIEFVPNGAKDNDDNAGLRCVELLQEKGVNCAVAGRFGSKVIDVLKASRVQMVVAPSSQTVGEIIGRMSGREQ